MQYQTNTAKYSEAKIGGWFSLDSLQTRIGFRWRVESSGQKAKAHRFDCVKSHDKKRNELDVGKIDVFFKEDTQRIG